MKKIKVIEYGIDEGGLLGVYAISVVEQPANVYVFNGAKGTFIVKNPELETVLEAKGHNTGKVWDQILADNGSVQKVWIMKIDMHRHILKL